MTWIQDRSIRTKLLGAFLALGLVPLIAVSVVAYRSASSTVVTAAGLRVEDVAFNAIDKLDRNLFERYGDVQAFALSAPAETMEPDRVTGWMDTMMGAYTPIYKLMVAAGPDGKIIAVNSVDLDGKPLPATKTLLGRDVSGDAWFRAAMSNSIKDGTSLVDDLHHDPLMAAVYGTANGDDLAMGFTAPIKDANGKIIGVWTNRFNWDVATNVLSDVQERAQGSGMATVRLGLVGASGVLLAGPDNSQVLQASLAGRPSVSAAKRAVTGYADGHGLASNEAGLEGWAQSTGFSTYPGLNWTTIASQDADEVMNPARQLGLAMLLAVGIATTIIAVGAWMMASYIVRRVGRVGASARRLADGDLRDALQADAGDELGKMAAAVSDVIAYQREMATLATAVAAGDLTGQVQLKSEHDVLGGAFLTMVTNLRRLLGDVSTAADGLALVSQRLGAASGQTAAAVQQVTMAVQSVAAGAQETSSAAQNSSAAIEQLAQVVENVAQGAQDQARQIQVASDTTSQMAASIQQVAGDAQAVAAASVQTRASAENGASAVRETVTGMQEIKLVVTDAAAKVEELGRLGERIGAVVETIDDIAEQTNLLALNAAIEAARAGEHGRGFAVVADEVRKLAERSQRETKAIGELIVQVQAGTKDAVRAMESGSSKVEQGALKADQAGEALSEILTAVEATVRQVGGIASAAQEMSAGAQSVVDTMHSLSAVVEESSAATEEMAAQAGQVTGSIQSIAAVSEENSAATEEVSASAEEMTAQVEEMTAQADELANTAELLRELVARFRLEAGAESQGAPVSRRRSSDWDSASRAPSSVRRVS